MLHNTGPYGPNDVPVNHPAPVNMAQLNGHINMSHTINNLSKTGQQSVQAPSGPYGLPDYGGYGHPSLNMGSQLPHIPTYQHLGLPHSYMPQNSGSVPEMAWQNSMLPMNLNVQPENGVNLMNYQNNYDKRDDPAPEYKEASTRKVPLNIPQVTKTSKHISQDNYTYNDSCKYSNHDLDLSVKPQEKIQLTNTRRKNIENTVRLIENILINSTKNREEQSHFNNADKAQCTQQLSQSYGAKTPSITSNMHSSKTESSNMFNTKQRPNSEQPIAYNSKADTSSGFNLKSTTPFSSDMYGKAEIYRTKPENIYNSKPDVLEIFRSKPDMSDTFSSKYDTSYRNKLDITKTLNNTTDPCNVYSKPDIYKNKSDSIDFFRSKSDTAKNVSNTNTSNELDRSKNYDIDLPKSASNNDMASMFDSKHEALSVFSSKSDTAQFSSSSDKSDTYSKADLSKNYNTKPDTSGAYSSHSDTPNIFNSKHDLSDTFISKALTTSEPCNFTFKGPSTTETSTVYIPKGLTISHTSNIHNNKAASKVNTKPISSVVISNTSNDKNVTITTSNQTKTTDVLENTTAMKDIERGHGNDTDKPMSEEGLSEEEADIKPTTFVSELSHSETDVNISGPKIEVKVENTNFIDMDYLHPFLRDPKGEHRDNVNSKIVDGENSVEEAMAAVKNDISMEGYYECPHCTLLFSHPKRFLIHTKWHTFGLTYEKRMELAREREERKSAKREAKVIERMNASEVTDVPVTGKVYSCKDCDKVFTSKGSLKNHRQRTHPTRARECKICRKTIIGWSAMRAHIATHTCENNSGYQCMECPKRFKYSHSLAKHKDTHLEKTHGCKECPKMFGSQALLKMHMKTHERVLRGTTFRCTYCGKGFYECYSLQVHERTHRNERPFVCEICNTSFGTNSSLKRHMKVSHSTSKLHECSVCHRSFSTASIRDRHEVRLHSQPEDFKFPCKQCDCKYLKLKDLQKHVYKVHPKNKRRKKNNATSDSE